MQSLASTGRSVSTGPSVSTGHGVSTGRAARSGRAVAATACRYGLVFALAAVVAACGLQQPHPAASRGRSGGGTAPARACAPAGIRVTLDVRSAGVAAGTSLLPLDFTNVSAASCRLAGFPSVALETSKSGRQLGAAARYDRSLTAASVLLPVGSTAHIWLRLIDVMNLPASRCEPIRAAGFRVRLPGQAQAIFVSHPMTTCAKAIHGTEILVVEPFKPGRAQPGTAQKPAAPRLP